MPRGDTRRVWRPEDRVAFITKARIAAYRWAKRHDPKGVARFERRARTMQAREETPEGR